MLVDDTLCHETVVTSDKRSTELPFIDVKEVDYGIICTCCHPRVPLREMNIIDWKKVIFELACSLEGWVTAIWTSYRLV